MVIDRHAGTHRMNSPDEDYSMPTVVQLQLDKLSEQTANNSSNKSSILPSKTMQTKQRFKDAAIEITVCLVFLRRVCGKRDSSSPRSKFIYSRCSILLSPVPIRFILAFAVLMRFILPGQTRKNIFHFPWMYKCDAVCYLSDGETIIRSFFAHAINSLITDGNEL